MLCWCASKMKTSHIHTLCNTHPILKGNPQMVGTKIFPRANIHQNKHKESVITDTKWISTGRLRAPAELCMQMLSLVEAQRHRQEDHITITGSWKSVFNMWKPPQVAQIQSKSALFLLPHQWVLEITVQKMQALTKRLKCNRCTAMFPLLITSMVGEIMPDIVTAHPPTCYTCTLLLYFYPFDWDYDIMWVLDNGHANS